MTEPRIIGATWMVPVDPVTAGQTGCGDHGWLRDYAVLVVDGEIRAVEPWATLRASHPELDADFHADHILLPGLVNCHGHAGMSLLRGIADDQPLQSWLEQHIWPLEQHWVSEEFVRAGTELGIAEMLLAGTTTFSDMYFYPGTTAEVARRAGLRAQVNFPIVEFANNWAADAEQHIALGLEVFDQYRRHERISIGFAPHAPYTVSDSTFARIVMLAEEVDARIQIHLHETEQEVADSIAEYGLRPIQRLHNLGVLSSRTQAVHLTQLLQADIDLLAETATSAIHCPGSNLKLASGYCDIASLLENNIAVGLGTDSAASNNTLNTFDALRHAALLAKQHNANPTELNCQQAVSLATLGGARALGLDDITGSIRCGKRADIIAIDCRSPALQPVHNPIAQLAYTDCSGAVAHVWVDGRQVVANRQLLSLDTQAIMASAQRWQAKLAESHDARETVRAKQPIPENDQTQTETV